ncbi:hypothetical protein C8F04DRAFT_974169 [Mycena alexandri]|uniref:Uncharacterized protein n=1 Tax=Mycena alexandri TaxID=1745969 RepID=A0AAD6S3E9_9AGAR|nr:hypothetical protein C8F04DRAFT_974169 [Mycena alexandri]
MGQVRNQAWMKMLEVWWRLEVSTKFASSVKGFSTDGRPAEIHTWIKNARKIAPKIKDTAKFVAALRMWWKRLNPEWRVQGEGFIKENVGSLDEMRHPGANGFLGVLVALRWWREAEGETSEWKEMFDDVTWVMGALMSSGTKGVEDGGA